MLYDKFGNFCTESTLLFPKYGNNDIHGKQCRLRICRKKPRRDFKYQIVMIIVITVRS